MMFHRHTIGKILPPVALTTLLLVLVGTISVRLSAAHADTGSFTLSANPTSATVAQGDGTDYSITIVPSGYLGTVNVNIASCPPGATCTFDGEASKSVNVSDTTSVTMRVATSATGTPIGSYSNITVIGTDSVNQSLFASAVMSLTVTQGKGFSLNTGSKRKATVAENGTGTISIIMDPFEGFAEDVVITWGIRPANSDITFVPASGQVTLTSDETSAGITVNAGTQTAGTYTLDFTGTSTSGIVHTAAGFTLTVTSSSCTGATCGSGQTCTADGCKVDPAPASSSCNSDACYAFDAETGVQKLKGPAPDGCWASWPACQNVSVLKVRKDRQCNQWLGCRASIAGTVTQGDGTSKLTEPQCTQLGVCAQLGPDGRCLQYINPGATKENISFATPGDVTGSNSLIRWFSGYSSGFHLAAHDATTILGPFPASQIGEVGLAGTSSNDLVSNGNFEELRCAGGPRDGQSCIVPADCRTESGVCADSPEGQTLNAASTLPCKSSQECKNQKVDSHAVPYCRYITSSGNDVTCRNPEDSQWLGILPQSTSWYEAGFGLTPGDTHYTEDILKGQRRIDANTVALQWKVWEDEGNFQDVTPSSNDPKYPLYASFKHTKEGDNSLKVSLQPNAPRYTGVGIPLLQTLQKLGSYTLSFRLRIPSTMAEADRVPIRALLGLNYDRKVGGTTPGYDDDSATWVPFGDIATSRNLCTTDPQTGCSSDSDCDGGRCVATDSWQQYAMVLNGVIPDGYDANRTAFLQFVIDRDLPGQAFTFYLDDVSLKPNLAEAAKDSVKTSVSDISSMLRIPRRCRLYPKVDSPDCDYGTSDGTYYKGWKGYCLDKDPRNADLCLTWWPLDLLAGEGALGAQQQGYTGPSPLFQCVEQEGGAFYIDQSFHIGESVFWWIENEARIVWKMQDGNYKIYQDDEKKKDDNGLTAPLLKLRDIERIDILADMDGETDDDNEWGDDNNWSVKGATDALRDGSKMWFRVDLAQINRVPSDGGLRVSVNSFKNETQRNNGEYFLHSITWDTPGDEWNRDDDYNFWDMPCTGGGDDGVHGLGFLFNFSNLNPDNIDSAVLDKIQMKLCDERSGKMDNDQRFRFIVRTRQSCNTIVQTVQSAGSAPEEKRWSNRVRPYSTYRVPVVDIPYAADATPFGSITSPLTGRTPNQWGDWTPDGSFDAGIQVLESQSGSPRAGIPYALKQPWLYDSHKYCFDAATPNGPIDNPDSVTPKINKDNTCSTGERIASCLSTSVDSQCIGVPAKKCSGDPTRSCSQSPDCAGMGECVINTDATGGASAGIDRLKHIFAKSYGCWTLKSKLGDGTNGGKKVQLYYENDCSGIPGGGLWDASTWSVCATRPQSTGDDELCVVPPQVSNITVNGISSADHPVSVFGTDDVSLKFNYSVNMDQQPAKSVKVRWMNEAPSVGDLRIACDNEDAPWLDALAQPVVVGGSVYSEVSPLPKTFYPLVCVKDNWQAIGGAVFTTGVTVTQ